MARAHFSDYVVRASGGSVAPVAYPSIQLVDPITGVAIPDVIYADATSSTTKPNPFQGGVDGSYEFYLAAGKLVKVVATLGTFSASRVVNVEDPTATGAGGGVTVGGVAPSTQAMGDTAAEGTSPNAARADHKHGEPAFAGTGSAATVAHSDHTHSAGTGTLAGLTDVTLTSPANRQRLVYDTATSKWINLDETISRGGTVNNPAVGNFVTWRVPEGHTVVAVYGYRVGGTGATVNARKNGTSTFLASDLSLTSASTWTSGGAVQNASLVAGDSIEIMITGVTGSPTLVAIQIDMKKA